MHELTHCASAVCRVPPDRAFAFLADPARLGTWALGCWDTTLLDEQTVCGTSLFDGTESVVRVLPDPGGLTVDYLVGESVDTVRPRITVRVVPGDDLGYPEETCVVTLVAWRTVEMTGERWARLAAAHEAEVLVLRGRLERAENARDRR